jgi:hypothetical protein
MIENGVSSESKCEFVYNGTAIIDIHPHSSELARFCMINPNPAPTMARAIVKARAKDTPEATAEFETTATQEVVLIVQPKIIGPKRP